MDYKKASNKFNFMSSFYYFVPFALNIASAAYS
jgi:hypothetical protein